MRDHGVIVQSVTKSDEDWVRHGGEDLTSAASCRLGLTIACDALCRDSKSADRWL